MGGKMDKMNWKKIIITVISEIAAIVCAIYGGTQIQVNEMNNYLNSRIVNIAGDNNTITINDWKDLADAYSDLQEENATLKQQNEQYFSDYTEQKELNESLKSQVSGSPDLMFESLGLSIDGEKIPVDTNNSIVNINGREYWSREIAIKLLPETESYSKEDGNINVGRVLADKTNLFGLYVNNKNGGLLEDGVVKDSFNSSHTNAFINYAHNSDITFVLDGKYSKLKISAAIREGCDASLTASFTVKTDDGEVVYSSPAMSVKTEPYEVTDIPINNCKLLTIECNADRYDQDLILYDAVVYN